MTRQIVIFLLLFASYSSSRRILHQPFFPVADSPPPPLPATQPTSPSPQPQPQPKYPFSSLSPPAPIHHHHHPFFPFYTSPPSSTTTFPSTSLPTFPANISSIFIPSSSSSSSSSSKSHFSKKLLLLSLTLTLLSIAFIAAVLASLLYHRNHHNKKPPASDSLRLFPANLPTSDKPPPPPTLPFNFSTPSSEFLYLGTLVSPLHDHKHEKSNTHVASSTSVGYNRLGSPELQPLPPLPRQDFHQQHNLQDEDFFSPKESPVVFQRQNKVRPRPPPPPPPPPPTGFCDIERKEEILKPKLKALHWDKVRASSEKAMVWDRLKFSSFQ